MLLRDNPFDIKNRSFAVGSETTYTQEWGRRRRVVSGANQTAAARDRLRVEVLDGRGFVLLRGMPVEDRPIAESAMAYWGVGTYFGNARSQNAQGHLLGHVYDLGKGLSATNPNLRSYAVPMVRQYPALADLSRSVELPRLIHARCQAEMCAERFRGAEAAGVVDRS